MRIIEIWNRNHIVAYAEKHISDVLARYEDLLGYIPEISRNRYKTLIRAIDLGDPNFRLGRSSRYSLENTAMLAALWETVGTADPGKGRSLSVETPEEMNEAAKILLSEHRSGNRLCRRAKNCPPPCEITVLSSKDMVERLATRLPEFDRRFTEILSMSTDDPKGLKRLAKKMRSSAGPALTVSDLSDLKSVVAFASRTAALELLTEDDDENCRTTAESIAELDAVVKELNGISYNRSEDPSDEVRKKAAEKMLGKLKNSRKISKN